MLAVQSGVAALSPMLSFDLSAPSMTALLQEDESIFTMLGCLMPEAQHVEYVPAVQQMLKKQVEPSRITYPTFTAVLLCTDNMCSCF